MKNFPRLSDALRAREPDRSSKARYVSLDPDGAPSIARHERRRGFLAEQCSALRFGDEIGGFPAAETGEWTTGKSLFQLGVATWRLAWTLLAMPFCASGTAPAATNDLLAAWLNAQTNLHTWSADVVQTRSLKSLSQPLTARGRVWFAAPNQFRWELGEPATTIAVRQPEQMLVIYPRLKRAERYPLTGEEAGPWKDTFALLEAGFPRNRTELEARFRVVSQGSTNGVHEVLLQPRSASARRLMPQIKIAFAPEDLTLRATELQFADGSTLHNQFTYPQLNPRIDPALFEPRLGNDYKIVDPLQR